MGTPTGILASNHRQGVFAGVNALKMLSDNFKDTVTFSSTGYGVRIRVFNTEKPVPRTNSVRLLAQKPNTGFHLAKSLSSSCTSK